MKAHYYLKCGNEEEKEVTEQEFIDAEQAAGFRSKFGINSVATGGFSNGYTKGTVRYKED